MSEILVAKEKFATRMISVNTNEQRKNAILGLIGERIDEGWYEDEDHDRARTILEEENWVDGWAFLCARRDGEYEYVEITETEEL